MAVITADGLVGKVLRVFGSSAQVLLINDQSSGVGVILDKSRLQGVIKGTAAGEVILEKVMTDEQVTPGERIVTSGGDQIFPKGITVGTVMKVSPGADLFLNIRVRPSANLSRLEEVLVITKKEDRTPSVAETNSMRAVDILTRRLPSVPDNPTRTRTSLPAPRPRRARNQAAERRRPAASDALAGQEAAKPATAKAVPRHRRHSRTAAGNQCAAPPESVRIRARRHVRGTSQTGGVGG